MVNMFKKIKEGTENMTKIADCKKNQLELIEINNMVCKIKNSQMGLPQLQRAVQYLPYTASGPVLWSCLWPSASHN